MVWRYLGRVDPYLPVASKPAAAALPVDVLGSLGELSSPVVSLLHSSRWWRFSTSLAGSKVCRRRGCSDDPCGSRALFPTSYPESIEIFIGMVMLLGIAITTTCVIVMKMTSMPAGFRCLKAHVADYQKLTLYRHRGSIDSAVASMKIFAGSEVSIFTLEKRTPQA